MPASSRVQRKLVLHVTVWLTCSVVCKQYCWHVNTCTCIAVCVITTRESGGVCGSALGM